ncbi:hypothetical protein JNB91_04140 [Rhizobium wenxiniae]|uniref:hypothetical protein n=1 Tax=Rhizobium wenxiniae TaxID=1737357 RepID=UPI001C6ECC12|nr:hypothetical protein [Rhizobium wenxiniae]MBW9087028.1 hypothetical protein [Rhizobium wenxiniae]
MSGLGLPFGAATADKFGNTPETHLPQKSDGRLFPEILFFFGTHGPVYRLAIYKTHHQASSGIVTGDQPPLAKEDRRLPIRRFAGYRDRPDQKILYRRKHLFDLKCIFER